MPLVDLSLGTQGDMPLISPAPWVWKGDNIRVRAGRVETLGLFGPLRTVAGAQITLPGSDKYRRVFTTSSTTTGQIIIASSSSVQLLEYDATSTIATGRRWAVYAITPAGLTVETDVLTVPSAGRVEIAPVWWFADQDDIVVGSRADVANDKVFVWDRNRVNVMTEIGAARNPADPEWLNGHTGVPGEGGSPAADPSNPPTPVPHGAVGGGILNRILVLLGASSFTDPDPRRFMTIRWSDRFNYGQWTPSDLTLSGEIQLEGGSRIVGGGVTGFGVIAWTDKRMAMLTETFDNNVFRRTYVDGGRGLLSNTAWCEADGQVWWLDEARTLNVFDGGRPRQVINTNKLATFERLDDPQASRIFLTPNPEFGEIIISYSDTSGTDANRQLIYNYLHDVWYPWSLERTGWFPRSGVIRPVAIDHDGDVWQHDLDSGLIPPYVATLGKQVAAADVEPYDWSFTTNLITQPDPGYSSWHGTKITMDTLYAPAAGVEDSFDVEVEGFREPRLGETTESETQTFDQDTVMRDYRIGGKAIRMTASGTSQKTVWRFGMIEIAGGKDGER